MTDKEKAKAYDEALDRCKEWASGTLGQSVDDTPKDIAEFIFPELAESEDERIRTELLSSFKGIMADADEDELWYGLPYNDIIAWLEKQKEQKVDIDKLRRDLYQSGYNDGYQHGKEDAQKEQKPADLSEMMVHKEPYIAPVSTPMVADEQKSAECIDFYDEFYKVYTGPKNILAYVNIFVKKLEYVPIDIHELSACVYYVIKHIEEDTKASQKEQKPSEWSEEDSLHLANAILSAEKEWGNESCTAKWLKSLPERFNLQLKEERNEYDGNMDKECIKLCNTLNSIPSVNTFESCCGHLKDSYSIWFFCNDIITISRLGRCVERNYSDGKWELLVDSTDTHPTGVFWLRSKVPFQSYDEMEESVNELCVCIQYWFNTKFDSYFNDDACK